MSVDSECGTYDADRCQFRVPVVCRSQAGRGDKKTRRAVDAEAEGWRAVDVQMVIGLRSA